MGEREKFSCLIEWVVWKGKVDVIIGLGDIDNREW